MNRRRVAKRTAILMCTAALTIIVVVAAATGAERVALATLGALAGLAAALVADVAFRVRDGLVVLRRNAAALQRSAERDSANRKVLGELSSATKEQATGLTETRDSLEADRRLAARRHAELAEQVKASAGEVQKGVVTNAEATARSVEALLHLAPRLAGRRLMPPTGGFALDARSLVHLLELLENENPRTVLELGSGTSTVWLAHALAGTGAEITSLEHDEHYAGLTRQELERHGYGGAVDLRTAPLEPIDFDGRTAQWYARGVLSDIQDVDLLLVDGPPKSTGRLARMPALPMLADRLTEKAVVVIDDADRPAETETVQRWLEEFPEFTREQEGISRLAVLRRTP